MNPLWLVVGFLFGILIYLGAGVLLGPYLSPARRQQLVDLYSSQMMLALDRALLVPREVSGIDIVASGYDPKLGREKAEIGDEERYWRDPGNRLGRLAGKPLGIAPIWADVIADPLDCAIAQLDHEADTEHGTETEHGYRDEVLFPRSRTLWPIEALKYARTGGSDAAQADHTEQVVENSQQGYHERSVIDWMAPLMGGGAGAILAWFLKTQGGNITSGVPAPSDPFFIIVGALL